jgi:hypothetical protein
MNEAGVKNVYTFGVKKITLSDVTNTQTTQTKGQSRHTETRPNEDAQTSFLACSVLPTLRLALTQVEVLRAHSNSQH